MVSYLRFRFPVGLAILITPGSFKKILRAVA
jgi:hypothetical protein